MSFSATLPSTYAKGTLNEPTSAALWHCCVNENSVWQIEEPYPSLPSIVAKNAISEAAETESVIVNVLFIVNGTPFSICIDSHSATSFHQFAASERSIKEKLSQPPQVGVPSQTTVYWSPATAFEASPSRRYV